MSAVKIPKLQHYVPQFILKNFHDDNGKHLHVFDKLNGKKYRSPARNIASENGFYNFGDNDAHTLELALGEIEAPASAVFKKIIDEKAVGSILEDEKMLLSSYLAVQFVRTRQYRETLKDFFKKLNSEMLNREAEPIAPIDDDEVKIISIKDVIDAPEQYGKYFYQKHWFLIHDPQSRMYISDNPISLECQMDKNKWRGTGIGTDNVEIYYPLSKDLTLAIWCPLIKIHLDKLYQNAHFEYVMTGVKYKNMSGLKELIQSIETGSCVQASDENIIRLNSLQVRSAERFVLSSQNNFELVEDMIGVDSTYKIGPRVKIM